MTGVTMNLSESGKGNNMFLGVTEKRVDSFIFYQKRMDNNMKNLYEVLKEKILTQMKIMDTTIKGIEQSKEYQDA